MIHSRLIIRTFSLGVLIFGLCFQTSKAQNPHSPRLTNFPDSVRELASFSSLVKGDMILIKGARKPTSDFVVGDTLLITSPKAFVTDGKIDRLLLGQMNQIDTLKKLENLRLELTNSQKLIRDSLIGHWENVHKIDSISFFTLKDKYKDADALITRSTKNTERAIRQSYYSSILIGGVGGGVAGAMTDNKGTNSVIGIGIGIIAGPLLNWTLIQVSSLIWK